MNREEIIYNFNGWIGSRVRIYLLCKDTPVNVKGNKKINVIDNIIELTSHGYDEESDTIGDDNYGYYLNQVEKIEFVRDALPDEMGCIQLKSKGEMN